MPCTTSTPRTITVFCSLRMQWLRCIVTYTILHRRMWKLIRMLFRQLLQHHLLSLRTVMLVRHLCTSMCKAGHCLPDATQPTLLYIDNDACVKWPHKMTSKAARHIELRENSVREWGQDKSLAVKHVAGKINPSDKFTKEMRDGTHFQHLRDSFMSRLSDFLQASLLAVHHARQLLPKSLVPAAARVALSASVSSYFTALASSSFCRNLTTISHLCSAGRQLLHGLHGFVPSGII